MATILVANYNSIIIMWLLDIDDRRTASPPGPVPRASPASSPYVFVVQACTLGLSTKNCLLRLDELLRRLRGFVLCEDRLHRTHRLARSAVDTLVRVYEELIRALVDTVDRADLDAGLVLDVDTRLSDDIRHGHSPSLVPRFLVHADARRYPRSRLRLPLLGWLIPRAPADAKLRRAASAAPSRVESRSYTTGKLPERRSPSPNRKEREHVPLPARHGQRLLQVGPGEPHRGARSGSVEVRPVLGEAQMPASAAPQEAIFEPPGSRPTPLSHPWSRVAVLPILRRGAGRC